MSEQDQHRRGGQFSTRADDDTSGLDADRSWREDRYRHLSDEASRNRHRHGQRGPTPPPADAPPTMPSRHP